MRHLWILAPATALAATLAVAHTEPSGPATPSFAVEATFEKSGEREGQYACTSRVTDLGTGVVLTEPRTVFQAGEPAKTTTRAEAYEVEISLFVARGGGQVDHVVIVRRDGAKVAAHSTSVKLPL
jgi:hypothetical protein